MGELGDQSLGLDYAQTEGKIEDWRKRDASLRSLGCPIELSDVMEMFYISSIQ